MLPQAVSLLAALVLAGCRPGPLPDQTKLYPNVRLQAWSGAADTVDNKLVVPDPNAPIDFTAEGFASLIGLERLELRFNLSVGCWKTDRQLVIHTLPIPAMVKSWPASGPPVLHGFIEHRLEQRGLCQKIGVGGRDGGVSGFVRMTATSRSGRKTESPLLTIDNTP